MTEQPPFSRVISCFRETTSGNEVSSRWFQEHCCTRRCHDDGEPQLRVTKGKTYNTREGVKEETEPRWLEAVAVDGSTFDLVENWDQLKLPPTVSGKTLGAVRRRLPYWQQLMANTRP